MLLTFEIIILLAAILAVCMTFTNAIEHIGEELNLGDQVVGSLMAAIGTALPETILPLVAISAGLMASSEAQSTGSHNEIAIGAILGAPFMLATLALFILGLAIINSRSKRTNLNMLIINEHALRDITYFVIAMFISLLAGFLNLDLSIRIILAILLLVIYAVYFWRTIKNDKKHSESCQLSSNKDDNSLDNIDLDPLYLSMIKLGNFSLKPNLKIMIIQTILSLLGIILLAHEFVHAIELLSHILKISPLILSLIIAPIATELPEKVNSWIWANQTKDGLALGNITGAMVFQSTIPCAIGLTLTRWQLDKVSLLCAGLSLISSFTLFAYLRLRKSLHAFALLGAGSLYIVYLVAIILSR